MLKDMDLIKPFRAIWAAGPEALVPGVRHRVHDTRELEELLPPQLPQRYLWEEQKKSLNAKDKRQISWSRAILRGCVASHYKSPAAYTLIRESGLLALPAAPSTQIITQKQNWSTCRHN